MVQVFNLHDTDRLTEWKRFRDSIETSARPLADVAEYWSHAPFVNRYLDPNNPQAWPGPWKLILDGTFDDLAISLGMLYTIQLTDRFKNCLFEIYQTTDNEKRSFLMIDNNSILNWQYREVKDSSDVENKDFTLVWTSSSKV